MYKIQSILLNTSRFTLKSAVQYLYDHDFVIDKVDQTKKYYRFRQHDPKQLKKHGYNIMRTIKIIPGEIVYIVAYKE